jgi:hypothetical protein
LNPDQHRSGNISGIDDRKNREELTQPPDPGRRLRESVRLSFLLLRGDQGPLSGAVA